MCTLCPTCQVVLYLIDATSEAALASIAHFIGEPWRPLEDELCQAECDELWATLTPGNFNIGKIVQWLIEHG